MFKKLLFICTLSLSTHAVFAQAKLIEKISKTNSEDIVIPYEKYILPNGLTLIVHEDHSDPICHVDVTYHVGSAREEISKSGFAHFFEHMMFQGSDHVADEQHFKIITEAGGTLNGTTNRDRTNYFETVPSNQLEKMLWLEADRMGFLLDAVTQQKFEVQRATVKNERGQNYDNRPYGLVQETLAKNLYPYGHPYSWLTIGYIEDLNRVNVQDLKNFFMRWYGPNNAVVTVGGDVKTKDVVKMVEKYFGTIPQCPKVEKTILPSPVLEKDRLVSMTDQYAKLPLLYCAMPTVAARHKDEVALDCLAEILGGDNNSILYQRLVKTQKALNASCSNPTDELAGSFQFSVTPKPGTPLADMEKEIRAALKEFEAKGVSNEALAKFKLNREAYQIYDLESVSGKVSKLASYQTFTGDANYLKKEMKQLSELTKDDVIRVYNQYIKDKPMVILSVLTKGTENLIVGKDNYEVKNQGYVAPNYGYDNLKYVKAVDQFDSNTMPQAGENPTIHVPAFKTTEKENMKMIYAKSDEIPTVVISLGFKGGRMLEQNNLQQVGLSNFFANMMDEDTKKHSAEEMSVLLDKMGSSINISADLDEVNVSVRCLKKNLNATLDLLEERLLEPKFTQESFDRLKNQTLENIKNSKTRAALVASNVYNRVSYSDQSLLGYPSNGTEKSINTLTLQDIENYYKNNFSRNGLSMVVVGDLEAKEAENILNRLTKLPNQAIALPPLTTPATANPRTVFVYNIPKAAQTEFRIGCITNLKYDATGEFYKCGLMNFPFGGAFNCRLNINLREDKGWTYGARGGFNGNDYTGSYLFSSGIKAAVTDSALMEIIKEFKLYQEKGINEQEIAFMKSAIGQSDARKYETGFQKAGFLGNILKHQLSPTYVGEQTQILNSMNKNTLDGLVKKWMRLETMNIVLTGDLEKIKPGLEAMQYKVIELDSDGNIK